MVKRVLTELRSGKPVSRGYLGITPQELDQDFQASLGVKEGVVVGDVQRSKAADKGGMQRLDVITTVDGQKITSPEDLIASISSHRAGDAVKMSVIRDGKAVSLTIVLGDRKEIKTAEENQGEEDVPSSKEASPDGKQINLEKTYGFSVEALTPANRHQFGVAEDRKGVVVTYVSPRSTAAEKGLAPGVVIVAVGTKEIQSPADFNAQIKKFTGKPLLLVVKSPQGNGQITMAIPSK
jgi:serine protease Do